MTPVTRQFRVDVEQSIAIDYLKEFGNATEWDQGSVANERLDSDPFMTRIFLKLAGEAVDGISRELGKL